MPSNQRNLQIQVREETREMFKQTFLGSGCDSQGTFLRELLNSFLSDDNVKTIEKEIPVPFDNPDLLTRIESLQTENTRLKDSLNKIFGHPVVKELFQLYKDKNLRYRNVRGMGNQVTINSELDVLLVILDRTEKD